MKDAIFSKHDENEMRGRIKLESDNKDEYKR